MSGQPSETVTVQLELTDDEQKALCHEFSEPYGHEIRVGILGKLRAALAPEGVGEPEPADRDQQGAGEEGLLQALQKFDQLTEDCREIRRAVPVAPLFDALPAAPPQHPVDGERFGPDVYYNHIVYRLHCLLHGRQRPTLQEVHDEFKALRDGTGDTLEDLVAEGRCEECGTLQGLWHKLGCPKAPNLADSSSPCKRCGGSGEGPMPSTVGAEHVELTVPCPDCKDGLEGDRPKFPPAERLAESLRWAIDLIDDPKRRHRRQFKPNQTPGGDEQFDWDEWASAHDWLKDVELAEQESD